MGHQKKEKVLMFDKIKKSSWKTRSAKAGSCRNLGVIKVG